MGTLGSQPARYEYDDRVSLEALEHELDAYQALAARKHVELTDLIALRTTLEYARRTKFLVRDGDYRDEHAAGFGEIVREFISRQRWNDVS